MVFVDGERTCDKGSTEEGRIYGDQLPQSWVMVAEEFEFGIEVEVEEDETGNWEFLV